MSKEVKPGGMELEIITGLHEILEKDNKPNDQKYEDLENKIKRVEVLFIFWKIIIEPTTRSHVLFITFLDNKLTKPALDEFNVKYKCKCQCKKLKY